MKSIYLFIAALVCASSSYCYAQHALHLNADAALFRYDKDRQLWEWYYAFPDTALSYVRRGNEYVGEMYCKIKISDTSGTIASQEWIVANSSPSLVTTYERDMIGVKQFALKPGRYKVDCIVADMAAQKDTLFRSFTLSISAPVSDKLALSDIEMATSLRMREKGDDESSPYRKGPFMIVPNPALTYVVPIENKAQEGEFEVNDGAGGLLSYYFEIYNANRFSPQGVLVHYQVVDAAGAEKLSFDKQLAPTTDVFPEYGLIPIDTLSSGVYFLQVRMNGTSSASADSIYARKKFYVLNPNKIAAFQAVSESQDFEMSEFSTMTDEQVVLEHDQILPLMTFQDKETYAMLSDLKARQKFLFRFWKNRDTNIETPENEALNAFRALVDYANHYFSTIKTPGWRTDRGRVLRQYGRPDNVESKQYTTDAKPYAKWYYYGLQGGVEFCFVELGGVEEFILVHSTARNEIRETRWFERYAQILGPATFSRDVNR
jgi:GWxTD domain-containing protein